jgi:hypothetical protein
VKTPFVSGMTYARRSNSIVEAVVVRKEGSTISAVEMSFNSKIEMLAARGNVTLCNCCQLIVEFSRGQIAFLQSIFMLGSRVGIFSWDLLRLNLYNCEQAETRRGKVTSLL